MGNLRKEDFVDVDIVDAEELLSSGTFVHLSGVQVVSTTGSSKNVRTTGYFIQSDDDDRLESGDVFILTGSTAADGTYTIATVADDDNFTVVDDTIIDSTDGTGSFKHPPGAHRVGFDFTGLDHISSSFVQEALEEIDFAVSSASLPPASQIGEVLFSTDGAIFARRLPVTSDIGWMINDNGILIVVG